MMQTPGVDDAAACAIFTTATPCPTGIEEFIAMPDGSFYRAALLSGAPLLNSDFDRVECALRRQLCDDVRWEIFSWIALEYERLGLKRAKRSDDPEKLLWCLRRIREACLGSACASSNGAPSPVAPESLPATDVGHAASAGAPISSLGRLGKDAAVSPGSPAAELSTPQSASARVASDDLLSGRSTVQHHSHRCTSPVDEKT